MAKDKGSGSVQLARPVDPSKNVFKLVREAIKRQDSLRGAANKASQQDRSYVREILKTEIDHVKELLKRDAKYAKAVRTIDTGAAKTEAERAQRAIDALAVITASNAAGVQKALTDTAITISKQTADTFLQVTDRLAALEKTANLSAGQSTVADPALVALANDVRTLVASGNVVSGKSEGFRMSTAAIVAIATLAAFILSTVVPPLLQKTASPTPQVIYVPATPNTLIPTTIPSK